MYNSYLHGNLSVSQLQLSSCAALNTRSWSGLTDDGAKLWQSRFAAYMQLVEFTGIEVISAVFPQYENRKIKPEETQRLQHKDMFTFNKDVVCRKKCIASL